MSRSPLMFSPLINPTSQDSKLPLTTAFFLRLVHAVQVWEPAPMMEDPASATVARQASAKPIANAFMLACRRVIRRIAASQEG